MAGARKMQMKMMVDFILEKTASTNEKDFIERYLNSQKITENLKSFQFQADSKLVLLKSEYQNLLDHWSIGASGVLTSIGTYNTTSDESVDSSVTGEKEKGTGAGTGTRTGTRTGTERWTGTGTGDGKGRLNDEKGDDDTTPLTDVSTPYLLLFLLFLLFSLLIFSFFSKRFSLRILPPLLLLFFSLYFFNIFSSLFSPSLFDIFFSSF